VSSGPVRVSVFGKTDLGRTRDHNEDTFLVADLSTGHASLKPDVRDHVIGPRGSLFMVADGMGGAAAGEIASQMAVDLIHRHLAAVWATDTDASEERFAFRMREALERANQHIHDYAKQHAEVRGMGTTATVAGVYGAGLWVAQIGDSRGYLARGGEVIQLTKDQSLMQRLVDAGELTEEEAEQSERRNIILQALGPDPRVKVDLTYQPLRRGDTLVICSDGLSSLVRRDEIGDLLLEHHDLSSACSALIDLANGRGGPDNITVVIARFEGEGLEEADGTGDVGYQEYEVPESATPTIENVPAPPSDDSAPPADPPPPAAPPKRGGLPLGLVAGLIAVGLLALVARCGAGSPP